MLVGGYTEPNVYVKIEQNCRVNYLNYAVLFLTKSSDTIICFGNMLKIMWGRDYCKTIINLSLTTSSFLALCWLTAVPTWRDLSRYVKAYQFTRVLMVINLHGMVRKEPHVAQTHVASPLISKTLQFCWFFLKMAKITTKNSALPVNT